MTKPPAESAEDSTEQSPVPVNADTAMKRPSIYVIPGDNAVIMAPPINPHKSNQNKTDLKKVIFDVIHDKILEDFVSTVSILVSHELKALAPGRTLLTTHDHTKIINLI